MKKTDSIYIILDCLDSHQDCTMESSSEFANLTNCQTNPLTRFHCKKSCDLCGKSIIFIFYFPYNT